MWKDISYYYGMSRIDETLFIKEEICREYFNMSFLHVNPFTFYNLKYFLIIFFNLFIGSFHMRGFFFSLCLSLIDTEETRNLNMWYYGNFFYISTL